MIHSIVCDSHAHHIRIYRIFGNEPVFSVHSLLKKSINVPSQYQFCSDVTSASFAFNWSHGRGATLTRAARRYAFCVYTEQALILSDVTTKLLVTCVIRLLLYASSDVTTKLIPTRIIDTHYYVEQPKYYASLTMMLQLGSYKNWLRFVFIWYQ